MRTLIAYYSYTGNNRLLAEFLLRRLGGDLYEIKEKTSRSGFKIILDMIFKRSPAIEKPPIELNQYEHVIFLAPVWASRIGSPLKSLIKKEKGLIPDYSFLSLCGYDRDGQKEKITNELTLLVGKPPKAVFELKVSDLFPFTERNSMMTISKYKVTEQDLERFQSQLHDILVFYSDLIGKDFISEEFHQSKVS